MAIACTRAMIEDLYGKGNVKDWADLDNDKDPVKVAARITVAINHAQADLESEFRGTHIKVPLEGTDKFVDYLWARMAGLWLWDNRSPDNVDPETGEATDRLAHHRSLVRLHVGQIKAGDRRTGLTTATEDVPEVTAITLS